MYGRNICNFITFNVSVNLNIDKIFKLALHIHLLLKVDGGGVEDKMLLYKLK